MYFMQICYKLYVQHAQMQVKVRRVTHLLMDEAGGSPEAMATLVANINSQRVMKPFLPVSNESAQTRFGLNVLKTLEKSKQSSMKAGSAPDLFRRAMVVAGAEGPLSKNKVSHKYPCNSCNKMYIFLH